MRAAKIVEMLFEKVMELTENNTVYKFNIANSEVIEVLFLRKEQAAVGFTKQKCKIGTYCILKVWPFFFPEQFNPNAFYHNFDGVPDLQFMGGPYFKADPPDPEKGREIAEEVRVYYGNHWNGLEALIDAPFIDFAIQVLATAREIRKNYMPSKKIEYWEDLFSQP